MPNLQEYFLSYEEHYLNENKDSKPNDEVKLILMSCLNMFFIEVLIQLNEIDINFSRKLIKKVFNKYKNVTNRNDIKISEVMKFINQIIPTIPTK